MKGVFASVFLVWRRYFDVYKKSLLFSLMTTFVLPVLYLLAFGFGLGAMIPNVDYNGQTIDYRPFVFAGIVGQTILFQSFFEAAYGGFIRMYYQRLFQSIAMTPIRLKEILYAELLWDASKASLATFVVLVLGVASGDFDLLGAVKFLPVVFLMGMMFSGLGFLTAALSKTIDHISYPQLLFVMPMFLFCGVFYPLSNLPQSLVFWVDLLPLTAVVELGRAFLIGVPLNLKYFWVLIFWCLVFIPTSVHFMTKRLVK